MKMRNYFKSALLASAFIVGFASCSNDDEIGGADLGDAVSTMVQVAITQSGPATYATEGAVGAEKKVTSATLYIFDKTKVLEAIVPLTVSSDVAQSKTFPLTTGMHYFYAALNAPTGTDFPTTFTKGETTMPALQEALVNSKEGKLTAATGFFMTNVEGPVAKNLIVEETPDKNKVTIEVGRAVAKVNVKFDPTKQIGGKLTEVSYKVANNPINTHFMPVYDSGYLKAPFFADPDVDLNKYYTASGDYLTVNQNFVTDKASYAIENSNKIPKKGNSSYVKIRGKFIPATTLDASGKNPETPSVAATFYRIKKTIDNAPVFMEEIYRTSPTAEVLDGGVAVEYINGVCYYGLWIADNTQTNQTAKYTVKRNNFYKVTITSVSGPGASKEDGDDSVVPPGEKEEELDAETQIQATIEILPWNVIDQSGGI